MWERGGVGAARQGARFEAAGGGQIRVQEGHGEYRVNRIPYKRYGLG